MHLSAYARSWDRMSSVRLSVRPSVTLVICDHIGWKSWKLTARTISPTPSLVVAVRKSTYSQGNMEKFEGDLRWGREKVACWRTKAAISLKRVKIEDKKAVLSQRWPRNAPYVWVPWKFSGLPDYVHGYYCQYFYHFMGFCSGWPYKCSYKIWSP